MKRILKEAILIAVAAIICGYVYNFISPEGVPIIASPKKVSKLIIDENSLSELITEEPILIGLGDAYSIYEKRLGIFIDARSEDVYKKSHIKGSYNVPYDNLINYAEFISNLPVDTLIVAYCDDVACDASLELAEQLISLGFTKVLVFLGGFDDWIEARYPVEGSE